MDRGIFLRNVLILLVPLRTDKEMFLKIKVSVKIEININFTNLKINLLVKLN